MPRVLIHKGSHQWRDGDGKLRRGRAGQTVEMPQAVIDQINSRHEGWVGDPGSEPPDQPSFSDVHAAAGEREGERSEEHAGVEPYLERTKRELIATAHGHGLDVDERATKRDIALLLIDNGIAAG